MCFAVWFLMDHEPAPNEKVVLHETLRFMSHLTSIQVNAEKVKSGPDGLFVINAMSCQQSCSANPYCKKFTWKRDTTPMGGDSLGTTPVMIDSSCAGCWQVETGND